SGVAIPSSEVYNTGNLAMVSPANTAPKVTDRRLPTVNRICVRDDVQGPAGAGYAKDKLGVKSVFVIHDKTAYGQGLADEFKKETEKLGLKVVGYEGITAGEVDFSAVLTKVGAFKPDMIYFGGMYPEAGIMVKQAREKGITAKYMGGDGLDSSEIVKIAGKNITGLIYTTAATDITKTAEGKAWAEQYKQKFGKNVESYSAYGYDAALVALNGIENLLKANGGKMPARQDVAAEIRKTADFKGIATTVTFDDKGDNKNAKVYFFEFKGETYPGELIGEK
ncbi:MAG: branched-chain amino acid ABC transporter substrate-binding protein, partial [Firmicutes bacterium]|nr:branched-chain amino acid ABC transporter substrate-binding protein [Bacillota bacterium]